MLKNGSFLKRLWRNRACSSHQLTLSHCSLYEWRQNTLSTIGNNSIITFRILPKPDLNIPLDDLQSSATIFNDLCELTKLILECDAETDTENDNSEFSTYEYDGNIADAGDAILDYSFSFCGIPQVVKRILILTTILNWNHPKIFLGHRAIAYAITQLQGCATSTITTCEIPCELLSSSSSEYIKKKFQQCQSISLFPPLNTNELTIFNKSIESIIFLCHLDIWQKFPNLSPIHVLQDEIKNLIENAVQRWLPECDKDLTLAVLSLADVMQQFSKEYINYFIRFQISYCEIVFSSVDIKLSELGQKEVAMMLEQLDSHDDNKLEVFARANMKLFESYKNLVRFAKDSQILCRRYTLRALEEDVKICDEKVLPSAVNFLAIHKGLCEDYVHLELCNTTAALMCSLKIALIIADDLIIYAKRMQNSVRQFESLKVLLSANSIEHTKNFALTRTSELLCFPMLISLLSTREASQANASFNLIIKSATQQCDNLSELLVKRVCRECRESITKHCLAITQYNMKGRRNLSWLRSVLSTERADHLLGYLDNVSSYLAKTLFSRLSDVANQQLLNITEQAIITGLAKGQNPSYYRQIEADYDMVRRILQIQGSNASPELSRSLYLNSMSTEQLILQYYTQLAESTENFQIVSNMPTLKLRIGYHRSSFQRITIFIRVISASNIPILDTLSHSSDPFCRIELMPKFFFPLYQYPPQTTLTRKQNLNPVWDQQFEMTTSEETFFTNGSVLCITVLDHDLLTYNDLAGQAYILLSRIPRIENASRRRLTLLTVPLLLPSWGQFHDVFQILVDRSPKSELAREVSEYERYLRDYRMLPPSANDIGSGRLFKRQKSRKCM
uniref:C2 domain-containing protein n=1 Tax=Syphacia muris TaxID=451379 RepID=A0A0N5AVB2_9BILA